MNEKIYYLSFVILIKEFQKIKMNIKSINYVVGYKIKKEK